MKLRLVNTWRNTKWEPSSLAEPEAALEELHKHIANEAHNGQARYEADDEFMRAFGGNNYRGVSVEPGTKPKE